MRLPILISFTDQGPVSRKFQKLFGPEKPYVKIRPSYSVKLIFSYDVKGIQTMMTEKIRVSRLFRFEDTKRMSPEMRPKSFGTFEKRAPALVFKMVDGISASTGLISNPDLTLSLEM